MVAGLCYFGSLKQDQLGIQAVQGVIFILVSENTFFPMYSTLSVILQEFSLFLREYKAGMYSIHVYYISRFISLVSILNFLSISLPCLLTYRKSLLLLNHKRAQKFIKFEEIWSILH